MQPVQLLFYVFAVLALAGAAAMVGCVRNVVAGALGLLVTMVSLAGIYVLLDSHLIAVIQLLAYAGAIVVFILFAIMLLDMRVDAFGPARSVGAIAKLAGASAALWLVVEIASGLMSSSQPAGVAEMLGQAPQGYGGFRDIGEKLFTAYVVPVEIAGMLLLAAVVGAIAVARRGDAR